MSEQVSCDVLIVGGGPAGLSVAASLEQNVNCLLVHQDSEIGLPVRTSGGTWVRDMESLGIPNKYYQIIDHIDFYSDHAEAKFDVPHDRMAVLNITELYQYLGRKAETNRTQIWTGAKFLETTQTDAGYRSKIRSREIGEAVVLSKFIVDASGWQNAVLESQSLGSKPDRTGVGFEYEFPIGDFDPNRAVLFVGQAALHGYGWIFPTANQRLRLGIGVINPDTEKTPREMMDAFVAGGFGARFGVQIPTDFDTQAGIIPSVTYDPKLVFGHIIRTGDAANFATPTVGEGIRIAIEFGRVLGHELTAYIQGDKAALIRYESAARKTFERDYKFGFMMNKRIAQYDPDRWDKSVRRLARLRPSDMTELLRSRFKMRTIARTIWLNLVNKIFGARPLR